MQQNLNKIIDLHFPIGKFSIGFSCENRISSWQNERLFEIEMEFLDIALLVFVHQLRTVLYSDRSLNSTDSRAWHRVRRWQSTTMVNIDAVWFFIFDFLHSADQSKENDFVNHLDYLIVWKQGSVSVDLFRLFLYWKESKLWIRRSIEIESSRQWRRSSSVSGRLQYGWIDDGMISTFLEQCHWKTSSIQSTQSFNSRRNSFCSSFTNERRSNVVGHSWIVDLFHFFRRSCLVDLFESKWKFLLSSQSSPSISCSWNRNQWWFNQSKI